MSKVQGSNAGDGGGGKECSNNSGRFGREDIYIKSDGPDSALTPYGYGTGNGNTEVADSGLNYLWTSRNFNIYCALRDLIM